MEVTIVDSEPSVVALIDYLDHLPTQPPSLYLDIEGVKLSRHGSISILQLFVLPRNHVFLIDIFVLQEKAFCTSNGSGRDLRSILESTLVPKVFFDVRNDSDALFALFQISVQSIHDVQLLEVATRSYSKERAKGLAKCIEVDAQLSPEASAAWKATKQRGVSLFAPEHGGSYEVFNSRPILQDIVDYCTQDVVYLPLLWNIYTRKISAGWMKKVQDATCERIRESHTALYEPHDRNKSLSPWANLAKCGQGKRAANAGRRGLERKTMTPVAQIAASEATKKTAATRPDAKPKTQPPAEEEDLRLSANTAALEAAQKTPQKTAKLERPLSEINLPFRSNSELKGGSHKKTAPTLFPAQVHPKWTCTSCHRQMQEDQKEVHLAGKQHKARLGKWTCVTCSVEMQENAREEHLTGKKHIARAKRAAFAASEAARQTGTAREETLGTTTVTTRNPKAKPRQTTPGKTQNTATKGRKRQAAVPRTEQRGLPYPPDHVFSGFGGSAVPRHLQYETAFSLEDMDFGLCDKDCGWCGHCMDGVDI